MYEKKFFKFNNTNNKPRLETEIWRKSDKVSVKRTQKKYFISKDTDILSKELPKGKFFKTVTQEEIKARLKKNLPGFNELELPAKIGSSELRDKKNRIFIFFRSLFDDWKFLT